MTLINRGMTPAYKVRFMTAADVLPFPLDENHVFSFPKTMLEKGINVIGPQMTKILLAAVPKIYSDPEENQIKLGIGQRIYMWGHVVYEDAFGIERFVKFAQSFFWLTDGNIMSLDTIQFNDAN